MSTKALIIDDEEKSISLLKLLLKQCNEIDEIFECSNSKEGFDILQKLQPDILFLDLRMPGLSGIEILKLIDKFNIHVHVIIITAYEKMVLEAARFGFIDYLLKPFELNELKKSIEKFIQHRKQHENVQSIGNFLNYQKRKIRIPTSFEDLFFDPEEIIYFEADGAYTHIFQLNNKKITSSFHLKRIQELLPADTFIRISRKHIINYTYLFKIDKKSKSCVLNHNVTLTELPFSKDIIRKSGLL